MSVMNLLTGAGFRPSADLKFELTSGVHRSTAGSLGCRRTRRPPAVRMFLPRHEATEARCLLESNLRIMTYTPRCLDFSSYLTTRRKIQSWHVNFQNPAFQKKTIVASHIAGNHVGKRGVKIHWLLLVREFPGMTSVANTPTIRESYWCSAGND